MRLYVVELVRRTIAEYQIAPGASWREVVAALNLPPVQFRPILRNQDGFHDGLQIVINSNTRSQERIEFTIFHEILHILIERDGRLDSELLEHLDTDSDHYRWNIENFCQLGAAEFVMPSTAFIALMEDHDWKIVNLPVTRTAFRCSLMAAAYQFAHWNPDPCTVVICEYDETHHQGALPSFDGAERKSSRRLMVTHAPRNNPKYMMRKNVPVPADHVINLAWQNSRAVAGKAKGFYNNPTGLLDCEAIYLESRVYAVFYENTRMWVSSKGQAIMDF